MLSTEDISRRYPKQARSRDGAQFLIRPLQKSDYEKLLDFFKNEIKDEDVAFLKDNVKDPKIIKSWCDNINFERVFPLVAVANDKIIANSSLHMRTFGWAKNVGKVRVTVAHSWRKKGVGTKLIKELEEIAKLFLLENLWAEIVLEAQDPATKVFKKAGYQREGTLRKIAKNPEEKLFDVAIYIKRLEHY